MTCNPAKARKLRCANVGTVLANRSVGPAKAVRLRLATSPAAPCRFCPFACLCSPSPKLPLHASEGELLKRCLVIATCRPLPVRWAIVQHRQPLPDWFCQQLVAAREAKRTHQLESDIAGAQKAYDDIVEAASIRLALSGSDKYAKRCNAVLRYTVSPSQSTVPDCDDTEVDPATLQACDD